MRELIPDPVTHPRSRNNYNNISHAKTGMFGLAQKLITICHNRLKSTLYNCQGVYDVVEACNHGRISSKEVWRRLRHRQTAAEPDGREAVHKEQVSGDE